MYFDYDRRAQSLASQFPSGPRIVVIGSTEFFHPESEITCVLVGQKLADVPGLSLITGGVEGVGEATGRSFFRARCEADREPRVFHVLPEGEPIWDYGETHFAGLDMAQRREILARLARVYLAIEGGPGTVHEAEVAKAMGALVIPVGRSGGCSGGLYDRLEPPPGIDMEMWTVIGARESTPEATATAAVSIARCCLETLG